MSDNRIVARYTNNVVMGKPTVAKVLDREDYIDRQMIKNHERAVGSALSTEFRMDLTQEIVGRLAVAVDQSFKQVHRQVKSGTDTLDEGDKRDYAVVDFGEQLLATVSDGYLRGIGAVTAYLVNQAGDDIRDNIKEAPPPPVEKPQTVIVQQTGPKLRPAKVFEGGRQKYVIDE